MHVYIGLSRLIGIGWGWGTRPTMLILRACFSEKFNQSEYLGKMTAYCKVLQCILRCFSRERSSPRHLQRGPFSWLNAPFHKDRRSPSSSDREIITQKTQKNTKGAIVVPCSESTRTVVQCVPCVHESAKVGKSRLL